MNPDDDPYSLQNFLDPAWEVQQQKTFTAWCNSHLRKIDSQIDNILEDFRNGLMLIKLLEVISNETLPKPERGKMRFHHIANINKALEFIETKGVKLISIGAEEICDGNTKMTLGMIWTIILRFAIQDITVEDSTAKEGLLLWCQRKTAGYRNVNVQNFHTSFKDGLAFCALLHRHRPELIDYNSLSRDDPMHNLNLAFDVAAKHLDVPRMLDPEDLVNNAKPDELSVMAYVSSYYHAFSGAQTAETAANRIGKVLTFNMENQALTREYEQLSTDLLVWIRAKLVFLGDHECGDLGEAQARLETFRQYRRVEKPPKLEDKCRLETSLQTLQTRLRLSNKPPYRPADQQTLADVNREWKGLEAAEKAFEDWLLAEVRRLESMERLARKFHLHCSTYEAWSQGQEAGLGCRDVDAASLAELRALSKKHEAFEADLTAHQNRVDSIAALAKELEKLNYRDMEAVHRRENTNQSNWKHLNKLSSERRANITAKLEVQDKIDQLHLQYAKDSATFKLWLEQATEDVQDIITARNVAEIKALISSHEEFKGSIHHQEQMLKAMVSNVEQINRLSGNSSSSNPYTSTNLQELESGHRRLLEELVPAWDVQLSTELQSQQTNEELRRQFGELANQLAQWMEQRHTRLEAVLTDPALSLPEQKSRLRALEEEIVGQESELVDQLEPLHQRLQAALIFDNAHTPHTMETIRVGWAQLLAAVRRSANEVENQILTRDSKGLSDVQIEDFRKAFAHFDKSRNRRLEPNEFRSCLVSLGYNVASPVVVGGGSGGGASSKSMPPRASVSIDDGAFGKIWQQVDPEERGYVTFEVFLEFLTSEITDTDSSEQLTKSFRILASDSDTIDLATLRRELPADQVEFLIQHMPRVGDSDLFDYSAFVKSVYSGDSAGQTSI